jgi:eukaryotic-like serine/threonine-protein kinase
VGTRLAADLEKRFQQDTIAQSHYLPAIRATGRSKTTEALVAPALYELGGNLGAVHFALYPTYLRGEAYLAAKQGTAAAAEFQKILDHPGLVRTEPIGALAHLELGRAFVQSGEAAKAKNAYQDFFSLWKNADPDIPVLQQAKAEHASLH